MLFLGTSGWNYGHWKERFYPKGLPAREQLHFLAQHFNSVELNASFYRLPPERNFAKWYDDVPAQFWFAVKAPRTITHLKRLYNVTTDWEELILAMRPLDEKLGIVLAQFPPSFRATDEACVRMGAFLDMVAASGQRVSLELRHASWFEPTVLAAFERRRACVVHAESSRFPHTPAGFSPADYAYFRFHGPRQLYSSQYADAELAYWAGLIGAEQAAGKDVYVYFDNDVNGYALEDARRMRELLTK